MTHLDMLRRNRFLRMQVGRMPRPFVQRAERWRGAAREESARLAYAIRVTSNWDRSNDRHTGRPEALRPFENRPLEERWARRLFGADSVWIVMARPAPASRLSSVALAKDDGDPAPRPGSGP